jgi:thiol-disulfide isomerase/thioredoxin
MPITPTARRRLIAILVAAAAVVGGFAWRLNQTKSPAASAIETQALFALQLERPDGSPMAMASLRGKPLVVNFWATWCTPCVHEMPELNRFHQAFGAKGWQVVGIAIDKPEPVRSFLGRIPVGFPVVLAGPDGTDLLRELGNAQGGLPFSIVIDAQGNITHRKLGETRFEELAAWATP